MTNHDIYPSFRFYVQIDSVTEAIFTEVTGLQVETELMDYPEGGNNGFVHRMPGRTKVSNVTLKRGMSRSNELFKWYINNASEGRSKLDRRHVTIKMYDTAGKELAKWEFLNAYPVKWVGPQLNAGSTNAAIETFELAHGGLRME